MLVESVYMGKKNATMKNVADWQANIQNIQKRCTNQAINSFQQVDDDNKKIQDLQQTEKELMGGLAKTIN